MFFLYWSLEADGLNKTIFITKKNNNKNISFGG